MNLHIDKKGTSWWVCEYQVRVHTNPYRYVDDISYSLEGPFKTRVEAEWCLRKRVIVCST